jgi:hypothetical protein
MSLDIGLKLIKTPPQMYLKVDRQHQKSCHTALLWIADPPWCALNMSQAQTIILFKRRIALGRLLSMRDSRITCKLFSGLFPPIDAPGASIYAGQEARLWLAFYDVAETMFAAGVILPGCDQPVHPWEWLANCIDEQALLMPEAQSRPKGHKQTLSQWCGEQNRQLESLSNPFDPQGAPITYAFAQWVISRCERDDYLRSKWYTLIQARSTLTSRLKLGAYTVVGDKIEARGRKSSAPEACIQIKRWAFPQ